MTIGRILITIAIPTLILSAAHEATQWIAARNIFNRETNGEG